MKMLLFHTVSWKSKKTSKNHLNLVAMEHMVELGPESVLESGTDGTKRENNKFWFGATWDSERKEYFTDETDELLNGVADGLDKVKFGVLLSLDDTIEDKWSSVVLAETDNSKAGFRISCVVTIARAFLITIEIHLSICYSALNARLV